MSSITTTKTLTVSEFLALPSDVACELIDGQAIPKMSPKFFYSYTQKQLLFLLDRWSENRGRVLPEWAIILKRKGIEIISLGQSFGELAEKATDYLTAGVNRVWLVDTQAQTITVFYPDTAPKTFRDDQVITDELLPELDIIPQAIFKRER